MTPQDRLLKLFLRIIGTASLLAVAAVVMPYAWMDTIHEWLGMGELPSEPVVGYLARSTSAFYALLGGLLWIVSFDLKRHRLVLHSLGAAIILFGVTLLVIDIVEGLPLYWSLFEGPLDSAFGICILILNRGLKARPFKGNSTSMRSMHSRHRIV